MLDHNRTCGLSVAIPTGTWICHSGFTWIVKEASPGRPSQLNQLRRSGRRCRPTYWPERIRCTCAKSLREDPQGRTGRTGAIPESGRTVHGVWRVCEEVHCGKYRVFMHLIFDDAMQTAYTKEHTTRPSSWLCVNCCYSLGIDPFAKPQKAAKLKVATTKEDRAKIVHYEHRKGVTPLGELCIQASIIQQNVRLIVF